MNFSSLNKQFNLITNSFFSFKKKKVKETLMTNLIWSIHHIYNQTHLDMCESFFCCFVKKL